MMKQHHLDHIKGWGLQRRQSFDGEARMHQGFGNGGHVKEFGGGGEDLEKAEFRPSQSSHGQNDNPLYQ
jgi:hypothetical protein